jgi:acyl-CoA synthetase (AMP-forming)/AMP-acid ligase II
MLSPAQILRSFAFEDDDAVGERVALRLRIGPPLRHRELTFAQLRDAVRGQAAVLLDAGARPGDRLAILMPHTERLVTNFLGAIWAGLVPSIIAWPTAKMDPEKYGRNVNAVLRALRAHWLATDAKTMAQLADALGDTRFIDGNHTGDATAAPPANIRMEGTAFIQFSGGTTGTQKSVPISFEHLRRQLDSYARVLGLSDNDRVLSWLPLYHDMGLIACLMMPFVFRLQTTMFAPMEWVMDPRPFMRAIGETHSTLCWLPNFAFSFLAQRGALPAGELDLSSMRAFVNCSEPVRAESFDAFAAAFAPHGLRPEALHTSYAMAEATFAVTQTTETDPPRRLRVSPSSYSAGRLTPSKDGRTLASCGRPVPGVEVRVVDDGGVERAEGEIGEIWLRGDFVMDDYLDGASSPNGARSAFSDGWYRTGDLGAFVDGHLYVTARKKDVIIVGGINVYPEDVEAAVGQLRRVHAGRVVALGIESAEVGTERLVVVAEADTERDLEHAAEVETDVRKTVLAVAGTAAYRVVVVPPKWIVKSTAGKISRPETRAKLLARWNEVAEGERA